MLLRGLSVAPVQRNGVAAAAWRFCYGGARQGRWDSGLWRRWSAEVGVCGAGEGRDVFKVAVPRSWGRDMEGYRDNRGCELGLDWARWKRIGQQLCVIPFGCGF